jgi:carbamoyltransferase
MKKYILGINDLGDPSISIVKNGKIVFYIEEERLNRIKHSNNIFPIRSIKEAFRYLNISFNDIQAIAYNWNFNKYQNGYLESFFLNLNKKYKVDKISKKWQLDRLKNRNLTNFRNKIKKNIFSEFGIIKTPKILFYSHHYVHAYQSFIHSNFKKAICLSMDGSGEENCTTVWIGENKKIKKIDEINIPNSLGWFYSAFTEYLGFKAYDGEYKVMGLAAFGKKNLIIRKKINKILKFNEKLKIYELNPYYIHYGSHNYSGRFTDKLVKLLGPPKKPNETMLQFHKDLAFEVQNLLEIIVIKLCEKYFNKTGIRNICLGGGVALNVKLNSKIFKQKFIDNIFPNPLCPDNGAAAGSALIADANLNKSKINSLNSLSLGPGYKDKYIEKLLKENKINFFKPKNLSLHIAKLLASKKIVGWFQGRMEAGARALGNRSILGDPRDIKTRDKINKIIKYREMWRPFCPSILSEKVKDYFPKSYNSKFMTISFDANKDLKKIAPAIVHIDNTCRIQAVNKKNNSSFYKLIHEFYYITGVPILLNTSFNIKGEPIVCSPNDALRTFFSTGMDVLVLEKCVIIK